VRRRNGEGRARCFAALAQNNDGCGHSHAKLRAANTLATQRGKLAEHARRASARYPCEIASQVVVGRTLLAALRGAARRHNRHNRAHPPAQRRALFILRESGLLLLCVCVGAQQARAARAARTRVSAPSPARRAAAPLRRRALTLSDHWQIKQGLFLQQPQAVGVN
jgi:hypothetical protein